MYPYASEGDALADALRLSKGMTYKNAVAGLPLGGGKCVIIADPANPKKPELLRAFAQHVQSLQGDIGQRSMWVWGPMMRIFWLKIVIMSLRAPLNMKRDLIHLNSPRWVDLWVFRRFRKRS